MAAKSCANSDQKMVDDAAEALDVCNDIEMAHSIACSREEAIEAQVHQEPPDVRSESEPLGCSSSKDTDNSAHGTQHTDAMCATEGVDATQTQVDSELSNFLQNMWNACPISGNFAYVAVIFGKKASYCIDALVLGETLVFHGSRHKLVLLHTRDVPHQWRDSLKKVGWELREVEYIDGENFYTGSQRGRFAGVFTKLHALNLTEFDKVVMLDTDLLVRGNIDSLFSRPTPSAMRRHASADYEDQELIEKEKFVDEDIGRLISGINAGVMVMTPSASDFQAMCKEVARKQPHYLKSPMPEQDYLSRFYAGKWHHLSVSFNFQPHQIAFTDRRGLENCERLSMDYNDDVKIVHFSAIPKPRDYLIDSTYEGMDERVYAEKVLLQEYMKGFQTDRRFQGYSKLSPEVISAQMRHATRGSSGQWFEHWHRLKEKQPELGFLIEVAKLPGGAEEETPIARSDDRSRSSRRFAAPRRTPMPPPPPMQSSDNVVLSNLPARFSKDDVMRFIGNAAAVRWCSVRLDKYNEGYATALVECASVDDATKMIEEFDNKVPSGCSEAISVRISRRSSGKGKAKGGKDDRNNDWPRRQQNQHGKSNGKSKESKVAHRGSKNVGKHQGRGDS